VRKLPAVAVGCCRGQGKAAMLLYEDAKASAFAFVTANSAEKPRALYAGKTAPRLSTG